MRYPLETEKLLGRYAEYTKRYPTRFIITMINNSHNEIWCVVKDSITGEKAPFIVKKSPHLNYDNPYTGTEPYTIVDAINLLEKRIAQDCADGDKWNTRFLNLAKTVSSYSKDPSTKVGAVIVDDDDNVRTIGYNGFPRGVEDTEERLNDRSIKYPLTVHAELNAICTCARVGVPTKGATMVCTHFPCADCAGAIVQAGFKEVVVLAPSEDFDSRWNETNNHAHTIFTEGKVDVIVFTEDELE